MSFNDKEGAFFWSNGYQYGTVKIKNSGTKKMVTLTVNNGVLNLKSFSLNGFGQVKFKKGKVFNNKENIQFAITQQ